MTIKIGGAKVKDRFTVETPLIDPDTTAGVQPVGKSGYTLTMSEEFNGSSVVVDDAGLGYVHFRPGGMQWATWYPNWTRFTSQSPGGNHTNTNDASYFTTAQVSLDGSGSCVLTSNHTTTVSGLPYTSGMIQSLPSFDQFYGYFETRIKIPSTFTGLWPAAWTHTSETNQWPPEIDYFEHYHNDSTYYTNVYMPLGGNYIDNTTAATVTNFNVYGCEWRSSGVTFYLNGTQVNTTTKSPAHEMFLIFDLAAEASSSPAYSTATMLIDYVRVWQ